MAYPNSLGRPMDGSNLLHYDCHPLLKRAGLPPMHFHDLRHTAATLLLGKGINPNIVSALVGHASVAITLDLCSHVLPDMQQQAAAAMDAVLERYCRGGSSTLIPFSTIAKGSDRSHRLPTCFLARVVLQFAETMLRVGGHGDSGHGETGGDLGTAAHGAQRAARESEGSCDGKTYRSGADSIDSLASPSALNDRIR